MSWCKEHECPDFVCEVFAHHTAAGKECIDAFRKRYECQPPTVQAFVRRLGENARKDNDEDVTFGRIQRRSLVWLVVAYIALVGVIGYALLR